MSENKRSKYLVFIDEKYIRNSEGYFGSTDFDDPNMDWDDGGLWKEVSGPVLVMQGEFENEKEVADKLVSTYSRKNQYPHIDLNRFIIMKI